MSLLLFHLLRKMNILLIIVFIVCFYIFTNLYLIKENFAVSTQLCNTIADELTRTADNVVQLYKRLTLDGSGDPTGTAIDRDTMLRGLESSVNEAMRTLRLVVAANNEENSTENVTTNEATAKFQELLVGQDQGKVVNMMQQYSEMLLSMMQQRMGGTQANHS